MQCLDRAAKKPPTQEQWRAIEKTMRSTIGAIDWLCFVRRPRRLTIDAPPAVLADHHRQAALISLALRRMGLFCRFTVTAPRSLS